MNRVLAILFLGIVLAFVFCQSGEIRSLTDAERKVILKDIMIRFDEWMTYSREVDFDKALTMHTPDLITAENGQIFMSLDEAVKATRSNFERIKSQEIKIDTTLIRVLSPDIAIQSTGGWCTITDTSGVTSNRLKFVITNVWEKRQGQWYATLVHQSYVPMKQ